MEKFKINVLENEIIEIGHDEWLKNNKNYFSDDLNIKCKNFYIIYIDGKRYRQSGFKFCFNLKIEDIFNAKQLFLKKV
jgi:hypothetical protein